MSINIYDPTYLAQLFLDCEMFQTKVEEKMKTHISVFSNLKKKIVPFMR
jgi:hypothetical protein